MTYMSFKTISISALLAAGLIISCGSEGPDLSQYDAACQRVLECDPQADTIPGGPSVLERSCKEFLGNLSQQAPEAVSGVVACLEETPCEELSFMECAAGAQEELQGLIPGEM